MRQVLYRFVYDDPPWSVIVPESMRDKLVPEHLPPPDRIIGLGVWDIQNAEDYRASEKES